MGVLLGVYNPLPGVYPPCPSQILNISDATFIAALRRMGFDPFVMIYEKPTAPPITRHLQRWVNNKRLFYAIPSFSDYEPVKKMLGGGMETR